MKKKFEFIRRDLKGRLVGMLKGNGDDFWSTVGEKEVIPSVYSKYESVNLSLY